MEKKRKVELLFPYHDKAITAASWLPTPRSSSTTFFPFFPFFDENFFSSMIPPSTAVGSSGSRTSKFQISIAGYKCEEAYLVRRRYTGNKVLRMEVIIPSIVCRVINHKKCILIMQMKAVIE